MSKIQFGALAFHVVPDCSHTADKSLALLINPLHFSKIDFYILFEVLYEFYIIVIKCNLCRLNTPMSSTLEENKMHIVVFTPNQIIPVLHTPAKYLRQINKKAERFH